MLLSINILCLLILSHIVDCYKYETVLSSDLLIETRGGPIKGQRLKYGDYVTYKSFKGVPYAEPPLGISRFKPAEPKEDWYGTVEAFGHRPSCMQPEPDPPKEMTMSEDCLYLNIYIPDDEPATELLPVLFYVHGGEFRKGNGDSDSLGPQFFMRENIIVITANYRLGAFGFLSMDVPEASGNNGIKDILQALNWTQHNIEKFGGDPKRVTLGGFSAGSVIVNYLLLLKQSVGLFHQATMESGSALGHRFFTIFPIMAAKRLAKLANCDAISRYDVLGCLHLKPEEEIIAAQKLMEINDTSIGFKPFTPFIPVAEVETKHRIIEEKPIRLFKKGLSMNVPVMVGGNCEEGIKMYSMVKNNPKIIQYLNEDPTRYIPSDLYKYNHELTNLLVDKIKQFYFNGTDISVENLDKYFDLITDTQYAHSIHYWLKLHKSRSNSNRVYYYNFCFDGMWNSPKLQSNINHKGASHGDQVAYLFFNKYLEESLNTVDQRTRTTRERMTKMWANFVKTGNPTPEGFEVKWNPAEYPKMNHLLIDDNLTNIDTHPFGNRMEFWEAIYNEYYALYGD